jgi:hypothetical protein
MEKISSSMLKRTPSFWVIHGRYFFEKYSLSFSDRMNFHFFHFLFVAVLAGQVHANLSPSSLRADDKERSNALGGILDNSINFLPKAEAIMPRIEEWFVQRPFDVDFSTIINASSVFAKLAEYVVESERGIIPRLSFVYSSSENEATIEFEKGPVKEVKLTLLFRASEHGFRAREFHRLCDGKGPTVTLVKARNGRMAAGYNGGRWGVSRSRNPRGFLASIVDDPGANGGHSFQKHPANNRERVYSEPYWGPYFGRGLFIADRCNENERSYSYLDIDWGYGPERVDSIWRKRF